MGVSATLQRRLKLTTQNSPERIQSNSIIDVQTTLQFNPMYNITINSINIDFIIIFVLP